MLKKKIYFSEIKKLRLDDLKLDNKIIDLKKQLFFLKIQIATKQKIKLHMIKQTKQQIAQLLTLKTFYNNNK
uniref:Large ribosomal subunit protein uL29c n=1 Tax=Caloglossa beccarii TaxID=131038 RepID=A0A1Z1M8C5_9FLOR|nr:ribosomal protein L29 [Caloglossa beccarii]ARW62327.1 ribosomal protein L29 [Caloglossa beccarii]